MAEFVITVELVDLDPSGNSLLRACQDFIREDGYMVLSDQAGGMEVSVTAMTSPGTEAK